MQQLTTKPATWQLGGTAGSGRGKAGDINAQGHSNTDLVALAVPKRGKVCTVAKITRFEGGGERILAIVHRHQPGTQTMISMPMCVVNYAEARNVKTFYFRNDKKATMRFIGLADLKKKAYLKLSDNVLEYFIKITDMQPTAWRDWRFAEKTVVLTDKQQDDAKQLSLW